MAGKTIWTGKQTYTIPDLNLKSNQTEQKIQIYQDIDTFDLFLENEK